jgi:ParB-like chromosome segregation protein Spo0J
MPELQHKDTETIEVEKLIPYANNPKEHPEEQVNEIASSIKNYGFVQPIVTDADNEIIIGHGRLEAAKKLGLDEVPVLKHADLSDAEAKALRLADNKIAETDWEKEKLAVEIEKLTEDDKLDEVVHGFDEQEVEDLISWDEVDENEMEDAFGDIPDGERKETRQMTFTLHETQKQEVDDAIDNVKNNSSFDDAPIDNSNGNALTQICRRFNEVNHGNG